VRKEFQKVLSRKGEGEKNEENSDFAAGMAIPA